MGINNLNIKISGAGCPNSCGIAHLNDIGFIGIVEPEIDKEKCNGCGLCEKACRMKAIQMTPMNIGVTPTTFATLSVNSVKGLKRQSDNCHSERKRRISIVETLHFVQGDKGVVRQPVKTENKIAVIDKTKCKYCGDCIRACPVDAKYEKRKGFAVLVGGREGEEPRLGQAIAEFVSEDEALQITEKCLKILKEKGTNPVDIIDEIGIENLKVMLGLAKY